MRIKLKDISDVDKCIYVMALSLEQPFTTAELLEVIHVEHPGWKIEMIEIRCKKMRKQKMLKKIGYFHNKKYKCLLSIEDFKNAEYVYSKLVKKLPIYVCGL